MMNFFLFSTVPAKAGSITLGICGNDFLQKMREIMKCMDDIKASKMTGDCASFKTKMDAYNSAMTTTFNQKVHALQTTYSDPDDVLRWRNHLYRFSEGKFDYTLSKDQNGDPDVSLSADGKKIIDYLSDANVALTDAQITNFRLDVPALANPDEIKDDAQFKYDILFAAQRQMPDLFSCDFPKIPSPRSFSPFQFLMGESANAGMSWPHFNGATFSLGLSGSIDIDIPYFKTYLNQITSSTLPNGFSFFVGGVPVDFDAAFDNSLDSNGNPVGAPYGVVFGIQVSKTTGKWKIPLKSGKNQQTYRLQGGDTSGTTVPPPSVTLSLNATAGLNLLLAKSGKTCKISDYNGFGIDASIPVPYKGSLYGFDVSGGMNLGYSPMNYNPSLPITKSNSAWVTYSPPLRDKTSVLNGALNIVQINLDFLKFVGSVIVDTIKPIKRAIQTFSKPKFDYSATSASLVSFWNSFLNLFFAFFNPNLTNFSNGGPECMYVGLSAGLGKDIKINEANVLSLSSASKPGFLSEIEISTAFSVQTTFFAKNIADLKSYGWSLVDPFDTNTKSIGTMLTNTKKSFSDALYCANQTLLAQIRATRINPYTTALIPAFCSKSNYDFTPSFKKEYESVRQVR